ncbi:hypothetical protein BKA62DRAFT_428483 [Auriculariales sp. MPI-PUGE-AT-0066]|nr:hypothetical protein BKA62DRAFT_428483 [Auriculariales sp. MPI-PUGE-AT-0066]
MPAAYLVTPAGACATLQSTGCSAQGRGDILRSCGRVAQDLQGGGVPGVFQGGVARVLRSSPQFAFTLVAYEKLHTLFPYPLAEAPRTLEKPLGSDISDTSRLRTQGALRILLDASADIGRGRRAEP